MVNPACDGLKGCEAENHKADDGVWVGPDVEVLLDFKGMPDSHASGGDVDGIGEDLDDDVEFEHDGMIDVEAQEDAANGEEEGPC